MALQDQDQAPRMSEVAASSTVIVVKTVCAGCHETNEIKVDNPNLADEDFVASCPHCKDRMTQHPIKPVVKGKK